MEISTPITGKSNDNLVMSTSPRYLDTAGLACWPEKVDRGTDAGRPAHYHPTKQLRPGRAQRRPFDVVSHWQNRALNRLLGAFVARIRKTIPYQTNKPALAIMASWKNDDPSN